MRGGGACHIGSSPSESEEEDWGLSEVEALAGDGPGELTWIG